MNHFGERMTSRGCEGELDARKLFEAELKQRVDADARAAAEASRLAMQETVASELAEARRDAEAQATEANE